MGAVRGRSEGFTLLEVTFATGILLLSFGFLLGSLHSLARVREVTEQHQRAMALLNTCLEELSGMTAAEAPAYRPARNTAGAPEIGIEFLDAGGAALNPSPESVEALPQPCAVRVTVTAHTSAGHPVRANAVCIVGRGPLAP
ncbi:MAG: hypothetical protein HYV26_08520 [Candidatus Hydrogenedentes bacterium]|nr:hypothetical protein [Candidatus Hydrogenedentota bacterium]